jgi:hypothetical protein
MNPEVNPTLVKILVIVGEYDSPEFQRQSLQYSEKLGKTFPATAFWKSGSDDHFTIVQNLNSESTPCAKRVQDFLKTCVSS